MAFISWLVSQKYRLDQIAQPMVPLGGPGTLAQLYAKLTSEEPANALPSFMAGIRKLPRWRDRRRSVQQPDRGDLRA
jgi:hypothetical protein